MHSHYGRLNDCTTLAHSFSLDLRLHLRRLHDERVMRRESLASASVAWFRVPSPPPSRGTHVHLLHRLLDDAVGKANLVEDPCMDPCTPSYDCTTTPTEIGVGPIGAYTQSRALKKLGSQRCARFFSIFVRFTYTAPGPLYHQLCQHGKVCPRLSRAIGPKKFARCARQG